MINAKFWYPDTNLRWIPHPKEKKSNEHFQMTILGSGLERLNCSVIIKHYCLLEVLTKKLNSFAVSDQNQNGNSYCKGAVTIPKFCKQKKVHCPCASVGFRKCLKPL